MDAQELSCDKNVGRYRIPPCICPTLDAQDHLLRQDREEIPHPPCQVSQLEAALRQFRGGSFYTPLHLSQPERRGALPATRTGGDAVSPPVVVAICSNQEVVEACPDSLEE